MVSPLQRSERRVSCYQSPRRKGRLCFACATLALASFGSTGAAQLTRGPGPISIQRIEAGPNVEPASGPDLTLKQPKKLVLVDMIPESLSDEADQESGPVLAVNPAPDHRLLVAGSSSGRMRPPHSALYVSQDGGWTWQLQSLLAAEWVKSQAYSFSGSGRMLYGAVMLAAGPAQVVLSVIETADPMGGKKFAPILSSTSSSAIANESSIQTHQFDKDRIYVGQNYLGGKLGRLQTAAVQVSTDGGKSFRLWGLETRMVDRDGPLVQPAISRDGTVYVAFMSFSAVRGAPPNVQITSSIVVCRDDHGATQPRPFTALREPRDQKPGRIVASDRTWGWDSEIGRQRIESSLSIAVDPNQSSRVALAWADLTKGSYTIHLRMSEDRGDNWSKDDLLSIPSATNAAVAIAEDSSLGLIYQQLVDAGSPTERWETHLQISNDRGANWIDYLLTSFFTKSAARVLYQPWLGERGSLTAVGNDFFGVFSSLNLPEAKNFNFGVRFQRHYGHGRLLSTDNLTEVTPSIDPFFIHLKRDVLSLTVTASASKQKLVDHKAYEWDLEGHDLLISASERRGTFSALSVPRSLALLKLKPWYEEPTLLLAIVLVTLASVGLGTFWLYRQNANIDNRLEEKVRGPVLANYQGYLQAGFTDPSGAPLVEADPGGPCILEVRLAPAANPDLSSEPVDLRGGEDLKEIHFMIVVDGSNFEWPESSTWLVVPRRGAGSARFRTGAPRTGGTYSVFVQAFQRTRLVQVVAATLQVRQVEQQR